MTQTVGPYRLVRHLATGGMAEVWLAHRENEEGKEVAIKRILPHLARDERFTTMFMDEAEIGSRLRHENIVEVLEVGRDKGEYFIAMEYVEGPDLAQILDRCEETEFEVDVGVASRIVIGVLRALDFAHDFAIDGTPLDIVHRDVSPHNILVTASGEVKLIDFGVAKAVERHSKTETGFVKGKLSYMSPEQIGQEALDRRADIFGVGALFFELLTGRTPFGRDLTAVSAILGEPAPDLREEREDIPEGIVAAIERALEKDAKDRHATAGEMADAIEGALDGYDSSLATVSQFLAELESSTELHLRETSDLRPHAKTNPATPLWEKGSSRHGPAGDVEESKVELTGALAAGAAGATGAEIRRSGVALPVVVLIVLLVGFGGYLGRRQIAEALGAAAVTEVEQVAALDGRSGENLDDEPGANEGEARVSETEDETEPGGLDIPGGETEEAEEPEEPDVAETGGFEEAEGFSFGEDEAQAVYADAEALRRIELEKPPENWLNEFWVPALIDSVAEPAVEQRRWDPGDPAVVDVLDYEPRPEVVEGETAKPAPKKRPKRRVKRRPRKRPSTKTAPKPKQKKKKRDGYQRMENALPTF